MATIFKQRTTTPSNTDKNFIHTSKGGKNPCLIINATTGFVLANCVGYVHGRWLELGIENIKLSRSNAEYFYGHNDGYTHSTTPKVGSVMCYADGWMGYGHVCIVEEVLPSGDVKVSESAYKSDVFRTKTLYKSSNYKYPNGYDYKFQGFIHPPIDFVKDEEEPSTNVGTYKVVYGDTATSISIKFKMTLSEFKQYNPQIANINRISAGSTVNVKVVKTIGSYTVVCKSSSKLNVRTGPGTTYKALKFSELTVNAQAQVKKLAGKEVDGYVNGVVCDVSKISDDGMWGKTASGYIHMDYVTKN